MLQLHGELRRQDEERALVEAQVREQHVACAERGVAGAQVANITITRAVVQGYVARRRVGGVHGAGRTTSGAPTSPGAFEWSA